MTTLHVDSRPASKAYPTINAAARDAQPGDTVLVHAGVYRERVNPPRGGEEGRPITYQAAPGEAVCIRGSEVFQPVWKRAGGCWSGSLSAVRFGSAAYGGRCDESLYGGFNPFLLRFNRTKTARPHADVVEELRRQIELCDRQMAEEVAAGADMLFSKGQKRRADLIAELATRTGKEPSFARTLGQVFVDGRPLTEVETRAEVDAIPDAWLAAPDGDAVWLNVESPGDRLVELSLRHAVFSPLERGLGHIAVRGFTMEHAANHFPTWGKQGWAQAGMLSTRSGHHWTVEDNTIRFAKGLGMDCGSEGGQEFIENRGEPAPDKPHTMEDWSKAGHHRIHNNDISDNGHCGLAGIGHVGTQVIGNRIERNNCDGWTSPWWEFAGIKFHFFFDGEIRDNLIRDNEAHGIWIDNQWRGSRITGNVIVNNLWSGINVELGRGPVRIDHNVIALTRQGDGIYGHDVADVMIEHNLLYANANYGAWFAYATPRVKPEDGCWDICIRNNIVASNRAGALALPLPWQCAGRNTSDGNLYVGAGESLDEGGGSKPPLFHVTNASHMANMPEHHPAGFEAQSPEHVTAKLVAALRGAGLPEARWPNLATWAPHYLLDLEQWRAATGNDRNSRVMTCIRDGLGTRRLAFQMQFDATAVGMDPVPGPFADLAAGAKNVLLWPKPRVVDQPQG
jgi:hypothetical protein